MVTIRWFVLVLLLVVATPVSAVVTKAWYSPGPSEGMDTWFGSYYNKSGLPNDSYLRVGGWYDTYQSEIRFNLGGMPQTATKVLLQLYSIPASGTPVAIDWFMNLEKWQENTVTWDTQPWWVLYMMQTPPPSPPGWYVVDITNIYNFWRMGVGPLFLNFGLRMKPVSVNNRFDTFYSSDYTGNTNLRPVLYIESDDTIYNKIVLKFPLGIPRSNLGGSGSLQISQPFAHIPWAGGSKCPADVPAVSVGVPKVHNATDYATVPYATTIIGTPIYAPEDGIVKKKHSLSGGWRYVIVMEHKHPWWGVYTTLAMHVEPVAGLKEGDFVPKGMPIATVADLGNNSHFHFALRMGAYDGTPTAYAGALPQNACTDPNGQWYPAHPAYFIDPEKSPVLFK